MKLTDKEILERRVNRARVNLEALEASQAAGAFNLSPAYLESLVVAEEDLAAAEMLVMLAEVITIVLSTMQDSLVESLALTPQPPTPNVGKS